MEPFIKRLCSRLNCMEAIEEWLPEANHTVNYWLEIIVGFRDEEYIERFEVVILTEDSVRHFNLKRTPPKRCLVVRGEYEWSKVVSLIQNVLDSCPNDDHLEFCEAVGTHFKWDDWAVSKKYVKSDGSNKTA